MKEKREIAVATAVINVKSKANLLMTSMEETLAQTPGALVEIYDAYFPRASV